MNEDSKIIETDIGLKVIENGITSYRITQLGETIIINELEGDEDQQVNNRIDEVTLGLGLNRLFEYLSDHDVLQRVEEFYSSFKGNKTELLIRFKSWIEFQLEYRTSSELTFLDPPQVDYKMAKRRTKYILEWIDSKEIIKTEEEKEEKTIFEIENNSNKVNQDLKGFKLGEFIFTYYDTKDKLNENLSALAKKAKKEIFKRKSINALRSALRSAAGKR